MEQQPTTPENADQTARGPQERRLNCPRPSGMQAEPPTAPGTRVEPLVALRNADRAASADNSKKRLRWHVLPG